MKTFKEFLNETKTVSAKHAAKENINESFVLPGEVSGAVVGGIADEIVKKISMKSKVVKIKKHESTAWFDKSTNSTYIDMVFDVYFNINDEFVDNKKYSSGQAFIYVDKKFYKLVESTTNESFKSKKIDVDVILNFNNTGNVIMISRKK